jgi:hypothetical protein
VLSPIEGSRHQRRLSLPTCRRLDRVLIGVIALQPLGTAQIDKLFEPWRREALVLPFARSHRVYRRRPALVEDAGRTRGQAFDES